MPSLGDVATITEGLTTGDIARFIHSFWSFPDVAQWSPLQGGPDETKPYTSRSHFFPWRDGHGPLSEAAGYRLIGSSFWGKRGVVIRQMGSLPVSIYTGEAFDDGCAIAVSKHEHHTAALWAYLSSLEFRDQTRKIDQTLKVTTSSFLDVPFDLERWQRVAAEEYPSGLPEPHSNDPTQWLFDGHPRGSADPNVTPGGSTNPRLMTPHGVRPGMAEHPLQVAVARLLGYRWPRQTGSSFMDCPAVAEPDEIDNSGLVDADGIVPLPALAGEADAATRLRELIRAVWGPDYNEHTVRELLSAEEAKATDLGAWLADEFFDGHCKLFHQTPFIWHIWDGVRGGFSVLVNYHRLCEPDGAGRRLLEKLRDSYLGEWIAAQRRAVAAGEAGAEDRLIAAEHLRGELTKIIEGEPPYDIFVR